MQVTGPSRILSVVVSGGGSAEAFGVRESRKEAPSADAPARNCRRLSPRPSVSYFASIGSLLRSCSVFRLWPLRCPLLPSELTPAVSGRRPTASVRLEQNRKRAAVTCTALVSHPG